MDSGVIAQKQKEGRIKVGYWGIRGLGAPLRMLLAYAGADFEDKQYTDPAEWFDKDKPALAEKNPLANLPYVEDGSVVVCLFNAVLDYLGDRFDLSGNSMEQRRMCRQLLVEIYDLRNAIIDIVYAFMEKCRSEDEFKAALEKHLREVHKKAYMKLENVYKQSGGPYALGESICSVDFHIWEILDQHEIYASKMGLPSPLASDEFLNLRAFHSVVKELPELKEYFESDMYTLSTNNPALSYTSKFLDC